MQLVTNSPELGDQLHSKTSQLLQECEEFSVVPSFPPHQNIPPRLKSSTGTIHPFKCGSVGGRSKKKKPIRLLDD